MYIEYETALSRLPRMNDHFRSQVEKDDLMPKTVTLVWRFYVSRRKDHSGSVVDMNIQTKPER